MTRLVRAIGSLRSRQRGQILPLFALMLVVICGFAALAIDVSSAYSTRRAMRSAADAAALAGAQNLQAPASRRVRAEDYARAKQTAISTLEARLGSRTTASCAAGYTCFASGYRVRLTSPLSSNSSCESCDRLRSLAVMLERPNFALTFGRILGIDRFDIGLTSVGTIGYARNYTVVTLRPRQNQHDSDYAITISGGSTLRVRNGDVATNGNMDYNGTDSALVLDDGFDLDYYDKFRAGPQWSGAPTGTPIADPVPDPHYWSKLGSPTPTGDATVYAGADDTCATAVTAIRNSPTGNYAGVNVPTTASKITCYGAGRHASSVSVGNGDLAVLLPGVHFFDAGLTVKGTLIGGYEAGKPGVTLVFPEKRDQFVLVTQSLTGNKELAEAVVLNAGSRDLTGGTSGTGATAALLGSLRIQTDDPLDPKPLTLVVVPTGTCAPVSPYGGECGKVEDSHSALKISGNAALFLGGVQYAPEDQVSITGQSGSTGYVGQLWAWTVKYAGGIRVLQEGAESLGPGLLRLDAACTTSKTKCGT